jgi:hypothetical protein
MTDQFNQSQIEQKSAVPIPYSVLLAAWITLIIGAHSLGAPFILVLCAWIAGPFVMYQKLSSDQSRLGRIKDNPPPIIYDFHAEGVYAAVDQTLKTLPGAFENVSVRTEFLNLNPPKNLPMHLEAAITMRHPDVDKNMLPQAKQNDMKSTIHMKALLQRSGNKCELRIRFISNPLIGRHEINEVIDYIMNSINNLVEQYK